MATERQIIANRENAQLSTGPRTPDGKANSSSNALRHGLAARGLIVLPGHEPEFEQLESGLRAGLKPFGTLQETMFKCVLESAWNLHRCRLAVGELYLTGSNESVDPLLDDQNEAKHTRIQSPQQEIEYNRNSSSTDQSAFLFISHQWCRRYCI